MGRTKSLARRRSQTPPSHLTFPPSLLSPSPFSRKRPRPARRRDPALVAPAYAHASAVQDISSFRGPVAALFELPVPPDAASVDLQRVDDPGLLRHAYKHAFGVDAHDDVFDVDLYDPAYGVGESMVAGMCPGDVAVFVKHWDAGTEVCSAGLRRANEERVAKFIDASDVPVNDFLLTIAVVSRRGGHMRRFDLHMQGASLPAVVVKMVHVGILRIVYVPQTDAVQFVVALSGGDHGGRLATFLRSQFFAWLYNYRLTAGETLDKRDVYDKEWAFHVVRRRKTDADVSEYAPFLQRVRTNHDLNVSLRPYQERAVAWMLSREFETRLDIATHVVWRDAERLAASCPLNGCAKVSVQPRVRIDVVHGVIETVTEAANVARFDRVPGTVRGEQESSSDKDVDDGAGRGGLLCDEMGLGKTVELMQLVVCNPLEASSAHLNGDMEGGGSSESTLCSSCHSEVDNGPCSRYRSCLECDSWIHDDCLAHARYQADKQGYVCLSCQDSIQRLCKADTPTSELPKSKATVVVIPTPLLLQWKNEISKHVKDALNVQIYEGHSRSVYVAQRKLVEADVVLTTYDALRDDVHTFHALRNPRRPLRHAKRYRPTPLPLLTVRWHRLAWDESQMLGARGVTQAAKLASYMHATYRWCVSGTPMVRSLSDALPMFDILRIQSGQRLMQWSSFFKPSIFAEDERRLKLALRKVMWRSSKEDVNGDELQLPPQVTEIVHTAFGPVERYHYSSLQQSVRAATVRFSSAEDYRSRTVSSDLLTMLRQACCHPQIGISGRRLISRAALQALGVSGSQTAKRNDVVSQAAKRAESPLDMNEVLDALVAKANADCAEALRSFVASGNGLAAVCWLQHSLLSPTSTDVEGLVWAVNLYRETLSLAEENRNVVGMDSIQRMHIMFNLNEALDAVAATKKRLLSIGNRDSGRLEAIAQLSSLGRTLRDASLMQEVGDLKRVYVAEAKAQLIASEASYKEAGDDLGQQPLFAHAGGVNGEDGDISEGEGFFEGNIWSDVFVKKRDAGELQWWHKGAAALLGKEERRQTQFLNRVVQKLLDAIPGGGMNVRTLAHRLTSVYSFGLVVQPELMKLQQARNKLREALLQMPGSVEPTQAEVAESGQCRDCREFGTGPACSHCRTEKLFKDVERRLYAIRETDETADFVLDTSSQGPKEVPSAPDAPADPKTVVSSALRPKGRVSNLFAQNAGGLRFQSEVETILKSLSSAAREVGDTRLSQEVSDWFDRLEAVKKEHTAARILFEAQRSLLARMDEVNMALMRFSVLAPEEDFAALPEDQQRHRLPRESLDSLNVDFSNEKAVAEADFRNKRGSLVYLKSLKRGAKQNGDKELTAIGTGPKRGPCAVCLADFDDSVSKVALFVCGHVLCCDCTLHMIKGADAKSRVSNVRCPTCRTRCPVEEINFITNGATTEGDKSVQKNSEVKADSKKDEDDEADGTDMISISGKRRRHVSQDSPRKRRSVIEHKSSFYDASAAVIGLIGAKASAVIRTLRGIWQREESAKVLIFSEWADVLGLLSRSLVMNNVPHGNGAKASSAMKFARMVDEFKVSESENVLLLPMKRAGAGLNLIEASHVILIEPSMNVSLESQAVGRVHRIGQEKNTYVHRIIMRDTIEETLLRLGDVYRGKTGLISENTVSLRVVMGAIHSATDADQEAIVVTDSEGEA